MTSNELAELVVDLVRQLSKLRRELSKLRRERDVWRLMAVQGIHALANEQREFTGIQAMYLRLRKTMLPTKPREPEQDCGPRAA